MLSGEHGKSEKFNGESRSSSWGKAVKDNMCKVKRICLLKPKQKPQQTHENEKQKNIEKINNNKTMHDDTKDCGKVDEKSSNQLTDWLHMYVESFGSYNNNKNNNKLVIE